ncbi:hypothetical protein [Sphingobium sp.]|uniref:hypothetical protein n=1 Tax=Sphingobium sp. TaxID=1912891 RepID=UPI00263564F5|nr:hypothetical protein [Sphingobium sp.]
MMCRRTLSVLMMSVGLLAASAAAARTPAVERRCVVQSRVAAPVVRDDGRLYFRGLTDAKQSYIAIFKGGSCPGLNAFATARVETTGAGYCEGDKVRALAAPGQIPGLLCVIDHLMPFAGDIDDPVPDESGNK